MKTLVTHKTRAPKRLPVHRCSHLIHNEGLVVMSILRSGGPYDADDVTNLRRQLATACTVPHTWRCLSDNPAVATEPLITTLPGWFAKLEVFRFTGPTIYLDLDTYLPGSINRLAEWIQRRPRLAMMDRPTRGKYSSACMAWHGDYSRFLTAYDRRVKWINDDDWISSQIELDRLPVNLVNKVIRIRSYKNHLAKPSKRDDLIYFYRQPKPRSLGPPYWHPTTPPTKPQKSSPPRKKKENYFGDQGI